MIKSIQTVETPEIEVEVIEVLRTVQPEKTRKTFSIAEHDRNHLDALITNHEKRTGKGGAYCTFCGNFA